MAQNSTKPQLELVKPNVAKQLIPTAKPTMPKKALEHLALAFHLGLGIGMHREHHCAVGVVC